MLYVLLALIFSFLNKPFSKVTEYLLDRFSPNFHQVVVFDGRLPILPTFSDGSRDKLQTNFRVKIGKIGLFTVNHLAFGNGLQYRYSVFKQFISDDHAIMCISVNMVNFVPVTLEFV